MGKQVGQERGTGNLSGVGGVPGSLLKRGREGSWRGEEGLAKNGSDFLVSLPWQPKKNNGSSYYWVITVHFKLKKK